MKRERRKHSKLDALPPEIVSEVNRLLVNEGRTYQEIVDWLQAMGHEVSRSSVGRYGKDFLAKLERLKIIKEQARTILDETQDRPAIEMTEAATQIAVQKILETLMEAEDLKKESLTDLIFALSNLEKSGVLREKLKMDYRRKAENAVKEIEKTAEKKGLDEETLRVIKEQIYGII